MSSPTATTILLAFSLLTGLSDAWSSVKPARNSGRVRRLYVSSTPSGTGGPCQVSQDCRTTPLRVGGTDKIDTVEDAATLDEKLEALEVMQREVVETKGSVVPLELQKLVDTIDETAATADLQAQYFMDAREDDDIENPIAVVNGERHFKNLVASPENHDTSKGPIDPGILEQLEPVLAVLAGSVEVLEAQRKKVRFLYHGLIRNQLGMEAWAKMLIKEHLPDVDEVYMCTTRVRDPWD